MENETTISFMEEEEQSADAADYALSSSSSPSTVSDDDAKQAAVAAASAVVVSTKSSPLPKNPSSSSLSSSFGTISIVLNTNARGVTQDLVDAALEIMEKQENKAAENAAYSPKIQVHVTSTLEEAKQAAKEIMIASSASQQQSTPKKQQTLVVPVGGDGTLTTMIDQLWQEHLLLNSMNGNNGEKKNAANNNDKALFPISFAYIPMGTGNALGSVVACQASFHKQGRKRRLLKSIINPKRAKREQFQATLQQLIAGISSSNDNDTTSNDNDAAIQTDTVELPLMQVKTFVSEHSKTPNVDYTFFAGVGFDSLMLQDYKDMQQYAGEKAKTSRLRSIYKFLKDTVLGGVTGYTIALFTRTLPQCVERNAHLMQVRISTSAPPQTTHWIDHRRGDLMRAVVEGDGDDLEEKGGANNNSNDGDESLLLYQGQAGIVAAGTAPFYGGGLRLFPFARMTPHGMHLRVGRIHPLKGVVNIPGIFAGSYRDTSNDEFGCIDFCGPQFVIDVLSPKEGYPVQHSGESVGKCTRVQFAVAGNGNAQSDSLPLPPSMRFVTLMPPRLVVEDEAETDR